METAVTWEIDEAEFATAIGLEYVETAEPGIRRIGRGKGFSFCYPDGTPVSERDRERCRALVLPPAWTDVWICHSADGHVQAIGLDEAGRRQYRYHDRWTESRRLANFDRLPMIGTAIGAVRPRLAADITGDDPVRRALAAMVRLMDRSLERIGNETSAELSGSYGISTLQSDHVEINGSEVTLCFVGKSGVEHEVSVRDRLVAAAIDDLGGDGRVFTVVDDGAEHRLGARDANEYLAELTRGRLHCKDFRTWGASAVALRSRVDGADEVAAVDAAAEALHNTRAVCRSAYVHPVVLAADDAEIAQAWKGARRSAHYRRRERALLRLLEQTPPLLSTQRP